MINRISSYKPSFSANVIATKDGRTFLKDSIGKNYIDLAAAAKKIEYECKLTKNKKFSCNKFRNNMVTDFLKELQTYTDENKLEGLIKLGKNKNNQLIVRYYDSKNKLKVNANIYSLNLITSKLIVTRDWYAGDNVYSKIDFYTAAKTKICDVIKTRLRECKPL